MPLKVGLLGPEIVGVLTHYHLGAKRTVPCLGEDVCPLCGTGSQARWKGYCPATRGGTREMCVVEITEGAARAILSHPLAAGGLRGLVLTLQRKKTHPNAPVFATLEKAPATAVIPPAFDPVPSLLALWGKNEKLAVRSDQEPAEWNGRKFLADSLPNNEEF